MKSKVFAVMLCALFCFCLTACELQTPNGTLSIAFDGEKKSEQTKLVDSNGKETVIHTESVRAYVDQLLDSVALPDGATTGDLKAFVYENLESLGIDLDALDFGSDSESVEQAEQAIKDALEEQGVDTSDLDINVEDWVNNEGSTEDEGADEASK